ncbi:competence protein CoiA [Reyranella sp.]|uniref:competence protein CoiA n=1 Tax=Reyranella sp. TaxID=1929291 RepID=UPI003D1343EC
MHFALVNNERVEAEPALRGQCPGCFQPVTARCGTHRKRHWAHLPEKPCSDRWWEPETDWHRVWKDNFPADWQEYRQQDPSSGEWHIADVRTPHDLVIEFQHSHLDPHERAARERFYRNMIWVVDGTRLKRDYARFDRSKDSLRGTPQKGYLLVAFPDECFPAAWLGSSVPVIFDFQGSAAHDPPDMGRNALWCLLPGRADGSAVVVVMSRKHFVAIAPTRPVLLDAPTIMRDFTWYLQRQRHTGSYLPARRRQGKSRRF